MITQYPQVYCTLNSVIQQMNLDTSTNVVLPSSQTTIISTLTVNDKAHLKRLIFGTSDKFSEVVNRSFVPYYASYTFDQRYVAENISVFKQSAVLKMPDDLLTVSSVVWNGTTLTANTDYRVSDPYTYPQRSITLDYVDAVTLGGYADTVTVAGYWGYHRNPNRLFVASGATTTSNPLSSSGTSLVVSDSDVFEVYQYIKIENEYLLITDITSGTDTLTVERGVNGTTAASHVTGTAISTYAQTPHVEQTTRRMVIKLFNKRGEIGEVMVVGDRTFQIYDEKFSLDLVRLSFGVV